MIFNLTMMIPENIRSDFELLYSMATSIEGQKCTADQMERHLLITSRIIKPTWIMPLICNLGGLLLPVFVIEGACRHFVKDRIELSGMRWSIAGAENLLHLGAVAENEDWEAYHRFRKQQR